MSRLSELILQLKRENPELGKEIEKEVRHLQDRRAFGLNFERHRPETVELYGRPVRKGDKAKMLPPRGETKAPDDRLWIVTGAKKVDEARVATLKARRTDETAEYPLDDLVVVAESHDTIYPGLVSTGKIERGGGKPFHTVINAENLHALKMLLYTHRGKIDCIYIDPPYNSGARDWKYNNDYVESDDIYRHSKWLAMMERRLLIAKELLSPTNSIMIVTIDEKEYSRLGLLLEEIFPEAQIQMVSTVINRKGNTRRGEFSRCDEYLYFVRMGSAQIQGTDEDMLNEVAASESVRWKSMLRLASTGRTTGRFNLFYPLIFDRSSRKFKRAGEPLPDGVPTSSVHIGTDESVLWPISKDGTDGRWSISRPKFDELLSLGYIKFGGHNGGGRTPYYLMTSQVSAIANGTLEITGRDADGAVELRPVQRVKQPMTVWNRPSHSTSGHGTSLVKALLPHRTFPYPKSLYAVEDALRFATGRNPNAIVLDFFAGSGTTAHAAMRLNKQDGGNRQCISVTNNEVAADEQQALRKRGLRPADYDWEALGICDHVTKPRIEAAITGHTPDGDPIKGDYKFTDEFPMADGLEENAEFFTLTYEAPLNIATHHAFARVAPMLWLRAGATGRRIDDLEKGWDVADAYGVIADLDHLEDFLEAIDARDGAKIAYIVTDDDRQFAATCSALPEHVEPVRLYESYLRNFQIDARRSSR